MSQNLLSPSPYASYTAQSGNSYQADANGVVSSVAQGDVVSLINLGCQPFSVTGWASFLPLFTAKLATGLQLAATAAAGVFGLSNTHGTSLRLTGEAAQNNTKTDIAYFNVIVPAEYVPGEDISVTVNCGYSGDGTVGTKNVDVTAYEVGKTGADSADLITTAAQALSGAAAADYVFTLNGAGLLPGDALQLGVSLAIQETANSSTLTGTVNSVKLSQAA